MSEEICRSGSGFRGLFYAESADTKHKRITAKHSGDFSTPAKIGREPPFFVSMTAVNITGVQKKILISPLSPVHARAAGMNDPLFGRRTQRALGGVK